MSQEAPMGVRVCTVLLQEGLQMKEGCTLPEAGGRGAVHKQRE